MGEIWVLRRKTSYGMAYVVGVVIGSFSVLVEEVEDRKYALRFGSHAVCVAVRDLVNATCASHWKVVKIQKG